MEYDFCVHIKYRGEEDEFVLTKANDPAEAISNFLEVVVSSDGPQSSRRWVEHIEAHWLHIKV